MFQSKYKKIWCVALILLLLVCCYLGIYHSHRYFGFDWVIGLFFTGFFALFILGNLWLQDSRWYNLKLFLLMLFVGVPIGIFVAVMHHLFITKELNEGGVKTQGVVAKLFTKTRKNSSTPYALFTYKANNRVWIQEIINKEDRFAVGDTLNLVYAKTDPEIFILQ